jgi:hypothetical protein
MNPHATEVGGHPHAILSKSVWSPLYSTLAGFTGTNMKSRSDPAIMRQL